MTALWESVAGSSAAEPGAAPGSAGPAGSAGSMDACEAWWTADERYVLRVAARGGERWYVGELDAGDASDALARAVPRPPREVVAPRSRTMLVGRQRGRRAAPAPMRLHVRRPPRI